MWILLFLFFLAILVRVLVGLHGYSGYNKPPMFGDYEAQRHWMEITNALPSKDWYVETPDNQLQYWGLDYPPLTAYHSLLVAKVAKVVLGSEFNAFLGLKSSRGYQSVSSKLFMRCSVLVSDLLFLVASVLFTIYISGFNGGTLKSGEVKNIRFYFSLTVILFSPAFILIDHGHFQYNCVCLGLVVLSVYCILREYRILGGLFYVSAICFKQTALYFAPAYFMYLFSYFWKSSSWKSFLYNLFMMGFAVILCFTFYFAPFLTSIESCLQVVHRMFPFARGLYEDKVANFWCATNIVFRWKSYPIDIMSKISTISTLIGLVPTMIGLFRKPEPLRFLFSLFPISLSFFLFSFQVHEKSVLFPLLPLTLFSLVYPKFSFIVGWFSLISNFSMFPLLEKDGLFLPYYSLQLFYSVFLFRFSEPPASLIKISHLLSVCCMLLIHGYWYLGPEFVRYPDLKQLLIATYSAFHFIMFYLWSSYFILVSDWKVTGILDSSKSGIKAKDI